MKYTLKFNWFEVLFYSFFVTYGYFGLMTKIGLEKNLPQFLISTLVLVLVQILFGYLSGLKLAFAIEEWSFEKKDFYTFAGLFVFLIVVTLPQLKWALFDDALSYAGAAHLHSVQGLLGFGGQIAALADFPFQYLAQIVSLILLIGLVGMIWFTHRLSKVLQTLIVVGLLVVSRVFIYYMGGNGSPHPSFELVMPFVFGSVFGLNAIAFKLSYLASSAVVLYVVCRKLQTHFSGAVPYLAVLAIGTIPLFLHISTSVEHSLWSGLVFIYVFAELILIEKPAYFRLIAVIAIATMMRQPCFIALIPVVAHYLVLNLRVTSFKTTLKNLSLWSLPVFFFIPFLAKSLIYGTPATQGVAVSGSALIKLKLALKSPIVLIAAANSVHLWWLVLIPFVFFTWRREFKTVSLCFRFFAIAAFVVFYSIHPSLWGHAKYQFEFIVPLSVAGFLILLVSLRSQQPALKNLIAAVLVVLTGFNIYAYLNYQRGNRPVDELIGMIGELDKYYDGGYRGLVTSPFNYREAFADIKALSLAQNSYVLGGSYGVVQEVLNGYSLSESVSAFQIYKDQQGQILKTLEDNSLIFDEQKANQDERIKAILIGPLPLEAKQEAIGKLQLLGWKLFKTYSNAEYGSSLALMLR